MTKVFHFSCPRENYQCDAAVVWCFDNRFHLSFSKFLKRIGIVAPDMIKVAGGAKALASPDPAFERDFVIDQIRKSVRLHGTTRVLLMLHSDCGAYGGIQAFGNDPREEAERQQGELRLAEDRLREAIPGIAVQSYFVDFEGVWEIESSPRALASGAERLRDR
jgi:hypothetical protein